jgi:hypothetical protein
MQTFVPFADIFDSARALDRKRLNKQLTESLQIHRALTRPEYGWQHHPAVRMWRGRECALVAYTAAMHGEWMFGGNKHRSMTMLLAEHAQTRVSIGETAGCRAHGHVSSQVEWPSWWGTPSVHLSHRSNLLRKAPEHYALLFEPGLRNDLPYEWPGESSDYRPAPGFPALRPAKASS